jgi:NADPH-dependent 2,4-dienoyl-CoA reductase/sulfur reductase-like enzyme
MFAGLREARCRTRVERDDVKREHIVIVGASLSGLSTAQELRAAGFDGHLSVVGAERHLPYDRPPLSKSVLLAEIGPFDTTLPQPPDLDATWLLGTHATAPDLTERLLEVDNGGRCTGIVWPLRPAQR